MFRTERPGTTAASALGMLELVFHAAVRNIRKGHGNALLGLVLNILQSVLLIAVFWVITLIFGGRGNGIRGDQILYVMSGVFMFMTHSKTIGAVSGAEGPTSAMMKHGPMNTVIAIAAAALSTLYIQVLSLTVVLYIYHAVFTPITIHQPVAAMGMVLLSWASGLGIGMIFLAARPWAPEFVKLLTSIYMRANMIASGKMLVANTTPNHILQWFDWNPLFHTIDQGRGFIFLNYNPHNSSLSYPIYVTFVCIVIGLMGEFYTRKHMSASWGARS
ncbi:MAG: ABC transporter permease [Rhodobacteraceae bacterium GWE1_64_9]|nr:MAG: ABC transporter permease [Rhodobacteraceae bacterium GWE1_64_9]OHC50149.1 MAG: ABC transporter permease [Rhodobacteraceae bacterium GWF1_65_7]HBD90136.1 ABC transporter permease [Gemmobacter sp.]HBU14147.1 ABC transporter permease [Gemmobacter sp.]